MELLYGYHPCRLALQHSSRRSVTALYVLRDRERQLDAVVALAQRQGVAVREMTKQSLNVLAENRPHQGVLLEVAPITLTPVVTRGGQPDERGMWWWAAAPAPRRHRRVVLALDEVSAHVVLCVCE